MLPRPLARLGDIWDWGDREMDAAAAELLEMIEDSGLDVDIAAEDIRLAHWETCPV